MRYLTMVKMDENLAGPPPAALINAMGEIAQQAIADGTLLEQGGLMPSYAGALIRVSGGKVEILDGPFAEAKELIGGYAIMQFRSKEDAVEGARRVMQAHADHWPGFTGVCEIRQISEH